MRSRARWAAIALTLTGCAAAYKAPVTAYQPLTVAMPGSRADLLRKAKQALVVDGYQITNADDSAGVISTAPRNLRLTPEQADCGTTVSLDYLKDNRTDTKVGYGVLVGYGSITIRTTIEGQYKPGAVDQNITLSCVSRGGLEQTLLTKIRAAS